MGQAATRRKPAQIGEVGGTAIGPVATDRVHPRATTLQCLAAEAVPGRADLARYFSGRKQDELAFIGLLGTRNEDRLPADY